MQSMDASSRLCLVANLRVMVMSLTILALVYGVRQSSSCFVRSVQCKCSTDSHVLCQHCFVIIVACVQICQYILELISLLLLNTQMRLLSLTSDHDLAHSLQACSMLSAGLIGHCTKGVTAVVPGHRGHSASSAAARLNKHGI